MSVSRIFLLSNLKDAQEKFAYYAGDNTMNVLLIGPTDIFRIIGQSPNVIEWKSGPGQDWYMVVVTGAAVSTSGNGEAKHTG